VPLENVGRSVPDPDCFTAGKGHGTHCRGELTQHDNSNLKKTIFAQFKEARKKFFSTEYIWKKNQYDSVRCHRSMPQKPCSREDKYSLHVPVCQTGRL